MKDNLKYQALINQRIFMFWCTTIPAIVITFTGVLVGLEIYDTIIDEMPGLAKSLTSIWFVVLFGLLVSMGISKRKEYKRIKNDKM